MRGLFMKYTLCCDVTDDKAGLVSQLFTGQRGWADGWEQQVWGDDLMLTLLELLKLDLFNDLF